MNSERASSGRPLAAEVPDKVNILLVDDQPARLLTYESILGSLNQNLITAGSGLEALDKLMRNEFAVVLLDVSMPEMDGFEAARLIHEHPRFERTPIIFVTGVAMSELDRLKGYKLGAVDYVSVPVVPEILRSKVSVLVELYCKRRELLELNRDLADTNEQLAKANTALQAEKTRELLALNTSLHQANRELERANLALQGEVAERARAEQALKEADRHKDEFLAMLAHELRNPLAPIRNAVQLMKLKPMEDPQLQLSRDIIERQLIQLSRLVDDLLDVSRITRGKINLARRRVELSELVARAVETVAPSIESRGHTLEVIVPKRALMIYGDPMRLTQALGNVLANAAKYTDNGGHITLAARRRRRDIEITVRDTGIGIVPEVLPCIFDLFTQLDRRTGRHQGGLGIGLALVKQLVAMHGGEVQAHSDGLGQGSEFTVRLPLAEAGAASTERIEAHKLEAGAEQGVRVLVVDDNIDSALSMAQVLQMLGYETRTVHDGVEAVNAARAFAPAVVLLDIGLPRISGHEAARRMRQLPGGEDIMLVALSGWGQEDDLRKSAAAGFDRHFVKPVDLHVLMDVVALARRPLGQAAGKRDGVGRD